MGRFLAVDYGQRRIGLAVSDTMHMIATHLETVPQTDIYNYLKDYVGKEDVELIVVGNPKQMDNTPSESMVYVKEFLENIVKLFPQMPIYMVDERYTSKIASQSIAHSGLKKKKRQEKGLIDSVSAVLILQDFMEMFQGLGRNNIIKVNPKE
ncbi:MAG: Holliday junction resolvase RuvX [Bacteroidales bacterium]|nr:Holliday junction resolvase RuvX [Candidatus Scybalousia scybalohippi]